MRDLVSAALIPAGERIGANLFIAGHLRSHGKPYRKQSTTANDLHLVRTLCGRRATSFGSLLS